MVRGNKGWRSGNALKLTRIPIPSVTQATPYGRGSVRLRWLDRSFGVGLLAVLGALRGGHEPPPAPDRIGLMCIAGIGDLILATAIAQDVVAGYPEAEVVLFAGPANSDLARLVEGARVVELSTTRPWEAVPLLRSERLDVLIDFGYWTRLEALYTALSGAAYTVGFATAGQRRHYAYDATVEHSGAVHELENFRGLAGRIGLRSESEPRFVPASGALRARLPDRYVVFHLWPGGYRSQLREWPQERWRELARRFTEAGFTPVLTGGPADVARTDAFIRSCGELQCPIVSLAGRRLSELLDVLADARCVISVNTGIMHLAAAVGAPTVALNGPTSARRWSPRGPNVICVDSELPGCGFLNLGFEYAGRRTDCMAGISVSRVAEVALERVHA